MSIKQHSVSAHPAQPTLTLLFLSSLGFWASCAAAYLFAPIDNTFLFTGVFIGCALGACLIAIICVFFSPQSFLIIMLACCVGGMLGNGEAFRLCEHADHLVEGQFQDLSIHVLKDSTDNGFAETALVSCVIDGEESLLEARFTPGEPHLFGQSLSVDATLHRASYPDDSYAFKNGVCGTLQISSWEETAAQFPLSVLYDLRRATIAAFDDVPDDAHALLQALVCGQRRSFAKRGDNYECYKAFQTSGLAHLIAVSGAHLVIVTSLFASLFKWLRLPRKLCIALLIFIMASYIIVSGAPVSAIRAAIMSSVGILSLLGKRRPSSLNALGITLFVLITLKPSSALSVSLLLSGLSTAGIIIFEPLLRSWIDDILVLPALFKDGLTLSLSASFFSLPLVGALFNMVSLIGPLSNVVCAPLFPLVCASGLFTGFVQACGLPGAEYLVQPACWCAQNLIWVVQFLASLPYAAIPISVSLYGVLCFSAASGFLLWLFWPRLKDMAYLICATGLAACIFLFVPVADESITMLDVGQGDSILVQSATKSLLIDTGNQEARLKEELARNHITHLDAVLITHKDDDHCACLDVLTQLVDVDCVIVAEDMLHSPDEKASQLIRNAHKCAPQLQGVKKGDEVKLGHFCFEVIWPGAFSDEGGNGDSLCLRGSYDGNEDGAVDLTALFTGDAEKNEIEKLIKEGSLGDIDILKVGHHGSKNALTSEQCARLKPEISLVSCGLNNRFGHPAPPLVEALSACGSCLYRTDMDGEICCKLDSTHISVECTPRQS